MSVCVCARVYRRRRRRCQSLAVSGGETQSDQPVIATGDVTANIDQLDGVKPVGGIDCLLLRAAFSLSDVRPAETSVPP